MRALKRCPYCGCRFRIARIVSYQDKTVTYHGYHVGYGDANPFSCPADNWEMWSSSRSQIAYTINRRHLEHSGV